MPGPLDDIKEGLGEAALNWPLDDFLAHVKHIAWLRSTLPPQPPKPQRLEDALLARAPEIREAAARRAKARKSKAIR
ncbi:MULTISPECIES: hypothetical protein [unclassified Mesorhizobium]|nr:hypothetical protein [Mesorhizobium sp. LSHC420B00]